jgi:hypothetical protein
VREVRTLLNLMRENEAAVQSIALGCTELLENASYNLKILDPVVGEEELVKAVAVELAKVRR